MFPIVVARLPSSKMNLFYGQIKYYKSGDISRATSIKILNDIAGSTLYIINFKIIKL